eukprot:1140764-Pelagomonas_calceolata.AAC.2
MTFCLQILPVLVLNRESSKINSMATLLIIGCLSSNEYLVLDVRAEEAMAAMGVQGSSAVPILRSAHQDTGGRGHSASNCMGRSQAR